MSVDKLVDSTQLDTDLTSVANAIRTKGGTSAQLAFPAGFVQAIGDIPSGGGGTEITTAGDYTINAGDTITMGTGLTGALTAEGQRVLTNSWDFTVGLTDSIDGVSATLVNGATQDSSGITIDTSNRYAQIPITLSTNKTYEIDFGTLTKTFSSGHGRVFMWAQGNGFIAQNGSKWNIYNGVTWDRDGGNNLSVFSGKTLRITTSPEISRTIGGATKKCTLLTFYVDGELWYEPIFTIDITDYSNNYIRLGSDSASFTTMVIKKFRIYDGTNV